MRQRRFKVDDLAGDVIRVTGQEAVHALRVLRLGVGADVILFDGRGGEAAGPIRSVGDGVFEVTVTRRRGVTAGACPSLTLVVATPKGSRADWLIEKCAELGVARLCLLNTDRGEVVPGEGKLERWRRKAIAAAKQAGPLVTMTIDPPRDLDGIALAIAPKSPIWYGDPGGEHASLAKALRAERPGRQDPRAEITIFIGPEGGFTENERRKIESHGGRPVRLAETVLRVETAAVATAALWACWAIESEDA